MGDVRAVIFDMDGLMINTELLAFEIFQQILAAHGQRLNDRHFSEIIGLDSDDTAEYILEATNIPMDPKTLNRIHLEKLLERMRTDLKPNQGLIPLLDDLRSRGTPLAVASNSPTGYVRDTLAAIQVLDRFAVVVGRDRVERGKPAPDVYLAAADQIGVPASGCLAVEDSPVGMQSAVAAGIRCIIVNEAWQSDEFSDAYARFPSLMDLHASLERLLAPGHV